MDFVGKAVGVATVTREIRAKPNAALAFPTKDQQAFWPAGPKHAAHTPLGNHAFALPHLNGRMRWIHVRRTEWETRPCSLGFAHLALLTWLCSLGLAHLALLTRPCSLGLAHSALLTWLCSLGFAHLVLLTWLCSLCFAHLALLRAENRGPSLQTNFCTKFSALENHRHF
jgi:hypothetical protein